MYQCFHCGMNSVVCGADFTFEDLGLEGDDLVHECYCSNCGAEIEYLIPLDDEDEDAGGSDEHIAGNDTYERRTVKKLIDANKLLAEAKRLSGPITGDGWDNFGVYSLIERAPAEDVVPAKHGLWVEEDDGFVRCSECGGEALSTMSYFLSEQVQSDFCPHCGVSMKKAEVVSANEKIEDCEDCRS